MILADASHTLLSISRKDVRELLRFGRPAKATNSIAELLGETAHLHWTEERPSGLVVRF